VFFGLTLGEHGLTSAALNLPPEVTHLWLWNVEGERCLVCVPDRGWLDAMKNWATD
jgi:hypothetical protein